MKPQMEHAQFTKDVRLVDLRVSGQKRCIQKSIDTPYNITAEPPEVFDAVISVPESLPFPSLWTKLEEAGFEAPDYIKCGGKTWYRSSTKVLPPSFEEIEVVENAPSEPGKSININDTLISYANLRFGKKPELNIAEDGSQSSMSQIDSLQDSNGLKVTFHRTVRMPDDDKVHQLPSSLGTFPIYNVAAYADALPDRVACQGGVFMPMWQREALWIDLRATHSAPYALRFSIGRINAVSGLPMDETSNETTDGEKLQDYVVVPGQQWIDGICVAPGIVRQFVAMPLGSGYTVEGQKTGEEKHGGLQIEIIPAFAKALRNWLKAEDSPSDPDELIRVLSTNCLQEYKKPSELDMGVGTKVRCFAQPPYMRAESCVSDMLTDKESTPEIKLFYPRSPVGLGSDWYSRAGGSNPCNIALILESKSPILHSSSCISSGMTVQSSNALHFKDHVAVIDSLLQFDQGSLPGQDDTADSLGDISSTIPTNSAQDKLDSVPHISTKDLTTMGLAAGGKIVQDIYRDSNPAHIWNTTAAKIVHVHILDPMSFEAVTHIVPPPPPIDVKSHAEEGGQFFVVEEQPEDRLEGGDFENVKSVSAMDKEKISQAETALDPATPIPCKCGIRMCDCVVRPCGHVFCNICIREIDLSTSSGGAQKSSMQKEQRRCPSCNEKVSWVAGFAAPMNLPGEEGLRLRVPVNVLKVEDGRLAFRSIQTSRI